MPLIFILLILLAFPTLEILVLIKLGNLYGSWLLVYLILVAILGFRLIREEKQVMAGRFIQSISQGRTPLRAIFGTAKNVIAGLLLIVPGVISDAIAVILLLIPDPKPMPGDTTYTPKSKTRRAANDDVIEGEFRRED
ncbi:MAG TPA: FxsA family protein [Methyloradius sp.]